MTNRNSLNKFHIALTLDAYVFLIGISKKVRNRAVKKIEKLFVAKREKELFLIYMSELPHTEFVEKIGIHALDQLKEIEIDLELWKWLFVERDEYWKIERDYAVLNAALI